VKAAQRAAEERVEEVVMVKMVEEVEMVGMVMEEEARWR
jgi:hypothetical protein